MDNPRRETRNNGSSGEPSGAFSSPPRRSLRREKRNSSITPRRFSRFFRLPGAPSNLVGANSSPGPRYNQTFSSSPPRSSPLIVSPGSSPLHDANASHLNRLRPLPRRRLFTDLTSSSPVPSNQEYGEDDDLPPRKRMRTPSQSTHEYPDSDDVLPPIPFPVLSRGPKNLKSPEAHTSLLAPAPAPLPPPPPIVRIRQASGSPYDILQREMGMPNLGRRQKYCYPSTTPHPDITSYTSLPEDRTQCMPLTDPGSNGETPFSLAVTRDTADGEPLIAVGDENGFVHFIRNLSGTLKTVKHWRPHQNAVGDLDFSPDGRRIASAAGDRIARVTDVETSVDQKLVNLIDGHVESIRQIRFQPGQHSGGNVLSTSDRAGHVQIWDLRYNHVALDIPSQSLEFVYLTSRPSTTGQLEIAGLVDPVLPTQRRSINSITPAHQRGRGVAMPASVTSLQWMPAGREHLLLTTSEANSEIRLWDIRYMGYKNQMNPKPLASTTAPPDQTRSRHYGMTSMSLNSDGTRLFATCKNNTIYAYSTAHLMLGEASVLSDHPPRTRNGANTPGLGPLYGFRHPGLKVGSFYVKCDVLPRSVYGTEVLAVGSSEGGPVLFPTDEAAIRASWFNQRNPSPNLPIVENGTQLIQGNMHEVTTVKWTHNGQLVTISDDPSIRYWIRRPEDARRLRSCGNTSPERWNCGWAEADEDNGEESDVETIEGDGDGDHMDG